jgi:saccharopine dehydrogenase (NAD+, L-lysine forming)
MTGCIGLRKETKDSTERRVPLAPVQTESLIREHGLRVLVEHSEQRVFDAGEFLNAGAVMTDSLHDANIVFGVKEIDTRSMMDEKAYMFFSHTIKGQSYNMPMLRHILEHGITLMDYELIKDAEDRRLVFFGNFAGLAGMIDSLWALGRRLSAEGIDSPFAQVRYASKYGSLEEAESAIREVGEAIAADGLPSAIVPLITGFTGYGNVSRGAQQIYDHLPVQSIAADELEDFIATGDFSDRVCYKVEFHERHMFAPSAQHAPFVLQEFFDHPGRYVSIFNRYLPYLSMLINGIYWDARFPRLLSLDDARSLWSSGSPPRLKVVGDITCDIDGSIQLTVKETNSLNPVYVHEPLTGRVLDGVEGDGPVILAVDKLPTELPREASIAFGASLAPFVPQLAAADFDKPLHDLMLPPELKQSIIAHRGELVEHYRYLEESLALHGSPTT